MKAASLRLRKRFNITYKSAVKYAVYFVLLYFLAKAPVAPGIYPFAFGFFFALVFAGQSMLVLSPLYVAACVAASPSLNSFLASGITAGVLLLAQAFHIRFKKPITLPFMLLYAALSQTGFATVSLIGQGSILNTLLTLVFGLIFMYAASALMKSVIVRGLKYKMNAAELACAGIVLAAVSCGIAAVNIAGLELIRVFAPLFILTALYTVGGGYAVGSAAVIGLGAAVAAGEPVYIGAFTLIAVLASVFTNASRWFAAGAVLIADLTFGLYFKVYGGWPVFSIICTAAGCAAFMALPQKAFALLGGLLAGTHDKSAMRCLVNRNRADTAKKMDSIAGVFAEMEVVFGNMVKGVMPVEQAKDVLAAEIPAAYCFDCGDRAFCHRDRAADTLALFAETIEKGIHKGKATLIDLPAGLTARCRRTSGLIAAFNGKVSQYRAYAGSVSGADAGRLAIGRQLGGVARIMESMAQEAARPLSFDLTRERRLMEELAYNDIICSECVINGEPGGNGALETTLIVKTDTYDGDKLLKAASEVCGGRMAAACAEAAPKAGFTVVKLIAAPKYGVVFGSALTPKAGNTVSGDTHSFIRIGEDKFMMALCDGMGSGEKAQTLAALAVSLIENFYKAGFDSELILQNVNKLLNIGGDENFAALDICVMNLREGTCDFIKIGAPFGGIKHKSDAEATAGGSLTLGALDEVRPAITRKVLSGGDIVVLNTDGVTDVFPCEQGYLNFLNNDRTANPQTLCNDLLQFCVKADRAAPHDDMSVLAARIFVNV